MLLLHQHGGSGVVKVFATSTNMISILWIGQNYEHKEVLVHMFEAGMSGRQLSSKGVPV